MFNTANKGWIGVDIGARMIKAAQLLRTRNGVQVIASVIPRSTESTLTPANQRSSELKALRALAPELRGSDGAAIVSMRDCTITALTSGPTATAQTDESGLAHDVWQAGPHGYRITTPLDQIESICDGLDHSGLRCNTVDGLPTALARALELIPNYRQDEFVLGIDWGASSATLIAAKAGEAVYARKLNNNGFESALEDISRRIGLSIQDSERAVLRYGFESNHASGAVVSKALKHSVNQLLQEVTRTLQHLGGKLKTRQPKRWVLFGVAGAIQGFDKYLTQEFDARCETWTPSNIAVPGEATVPFCMLGPAIALSALRWEIG